MPTTTKKTIKKQLTKDDVTHIVRDLFDTELKDKIKQGSDKETKQEIKELNKKIDSNFKWLLSIIIIGFMSIFFGFQQQINSLKDDNTDVKLLIKDINNRLISIEKVLKEKK